MATKKKFDVENPTDEMIENLEVPKPEADGFHITKLSERDSRRLIEILTATSAPSEEVKADWHKAKQSYERLIIGRRPWVQLDFGLSHSKINTKGANSIVAMTG